MKLPTTSSIQRVAQATGLYRLATRQTEREGTCIWQSFALAKTARLSIPSGGSPAGTGGSPVLPNSFRAGFTMIEIALCLAIIGFALVSILLVLPTGMNTQRDTREETIIGEDASILMEAIRGGARGMDDLTNYVYAITNYVTQYDNRGVPIPNNSGFLAYTYNGAISDINGNIVPLPAMPITNGLRIIGLLSTPEFTYPVNGSIANEILNQTYYSNHVVAYIHSFSGLAAEKPPQDNQLMQEDTFTYRLLVVNAPMATEATYTNNIGLTPNGVAYLRMLSGNLRDLRLLFSWPVEPNGNVGGFRQTFRMSVAGQLVQTNYDTVPLHLFPGISDLYFYQSQSFTTNVP